MITAPLNDLCRKEASFEWSEKCEEMFRLLKTKLTKPPILNYPDFRRRFILTTDASDIGCGAVLSQENEKKEDLTICHASRTFTKGERNKPVIEKELCALHWAIIYYKPYLYGTRFLVRTDHRPLAFLYNLRDPTSKLARIRLDLNEFNFDIAYIPGDLNVVADALSRSSEMMPFESIRDKYSDEFEVLTMNWVYAMTRSKTREMTKIQDQEDDKNETLKENNERKEKIKCIEVNNEEVAKLIKHEMLIKCKNNELKLIIINETYSIVLQVKEKKSHDNKDKERRGYSKNKEEGNEIGNNNNENANASRKIKNDECYSPGRRMHAKNEEGGGIALPLRVSPKVYEKAENVWRREMYETGYGRAGKVIEPKQQAKRKHTGATELCENKRARARERESTTIGIATLLGKNNSQTILGRDSENLYPRIEALMKIIINKAKKHKIKEIKVNKSNKVMRALTTSKFKGICENLNKEFENEMMKTKATDHDEMNLTIVLHEGPREVKSLDERKNLIESYHKNPLIGGHCGPTRLYFKLKMNYKWPKMRKEIFEYTKGCVKCQMNKAHARPRHEFQITDTPTMAFEIVEIDTVGPLQEIKGNKYIITIQCQLSKYVILAAMPDKTAKSVAKAIFDNLIYLHGFPKVILTDNGLEYKNQVMSELTKICQIEHRFSTAYHPQTIGALERNHRVLNDFLRSYLSEMNSDWTKLINYYAFAYNTTPTPNLKGYSPYFIVYGKTPNLPNFQNETIIKPNYDIENYVQDVRYNLQKAQAIVNKHLRELKEKQARESRKSERKLDLKIGDTVKVTNEARQKFDSFFTGPYKIVGEEGKNFVLAKKNEPKQYKVHKNRVAKFNEDKD